MLAHADRQYLYIHPTPNPTHRQYLYINSPGGSVIAGLALYDTFG